VGVERQALIDKYANKLISTLENILPKQPNEAEFRRHVDRLIDDFRQEAGLPEFNGMAEFTIGSGRADSVLHRVVIEYERPGVLTHNLHDRATAHAVKQAEEYIKGLAEQLSFSGRYMSAVVTDGYYIIFARYHDGRFIVDSPVKLHLHSARQFFNVLDGLSTKLALTVDNLYADFNLENPRARGIIRNLYLGFKENLDNDKKIVELLFKQWRLYFSEAIDADKIFSDNFSSIKRWASSAGIELKNSRDAEHFIFIVNTYFSLLAKFLALASLLRHTWGILGSPMFEQWATYDSEGLRREIEKLESGELYRGLGINNLLEGELMVWHVKGWNSHVEQAVRAMVQRLSEYDPGTLSIIPEETRDLFKGLYHRLIPREVRHALGEYYTPDWLAQHTLIRADEEFFTSEDYEALRDKLLNKRWLDPACGSGTFLVLLIKRMKEIGRQLNIDDGVLLNIITRNVVGFDVNPLAVLVSRVNYILAIQDLLPRRSKEINIPVYLTDSILVCASMEGITSNVRGDTPVYNMPLVIKEDLQLPESICKGKRFIRFANILEQCIDSGYPTDSFIARIKYELKLGDEVTPIVEELLRELYDVLLTYHKRNMNGIWARLLKNGFAPVAEEQFDYVVGNPPWVAWKNLPSNYRDDGKPLREIWNYYELLQSTKIRSAVGSSQADLSFLMTYGVAGALLKYGGKLAFVLPQSAFRAHGGAGFRQFAIRKGNGYIHLKVHVVDDMTALQPFENASTFTCVALIEKGSRTEYPVPYLVWDKRENFDYNSSLEEVKSKCRILSCKAQPSVTDDNISRWVVSDENALVALEKLMRPSTYTANIGIASRANSVFRVEILSERPDGVLLVSNYTKGSKFKVSKIDAIDVEPDLVYPLVRGKDIDYWKVDTKVHMIVPYYGDDVIPIIDMQVKYPRTYRYLHKFKGALETRADYVSYGSKRGLPFYGFGVNYRGDVLAPWKVMWSNIGYVKAAAVSSKNGKVIVPDPSITYIQCSGCEEAYYIAGMINSNIYQALVNSRVNSDIHAGYPRMLKEYYIPTFNTSNELHLKLADLSKQAHEAAQAGNKQHLAELQREIDKTAQQIWGLTDDEVAEILKYSKVNVAETFEEEAASAEEQLEDLEQQEQQEQPVEKVKKPRTRKSSGKNRSMDKLKEFHDIISSLKSE
jgi:SAM-dependent methyltransferase